MAEAKTLGRPHTSPGENRGAQGQTNGRSTSGGGATPVEPQDGPGGGSGLVRVTVNLTPAALQALDNLCEATGYSKTDVINRALQVYEVWQEVAGRDGGTVTVKHQDGETERIRLL
jgi:hypothetical protein